MQSVSYKVRPSKRQWLCGAGLLVAVLVPPTGQSREPSGPAAPKAPPPVAQPAEKTAADQAPEAPAPVTPRDFFNAGARNLRQGKLREAEAFFESALASQEERLQPPALYNLGHVRFDQGAAELKKGPAAGPMAPPARPAAQAADDALLDVNTALAAPGPGAGAATPAAPAVPGASPAPDGEDIQQLLGAYLHGRGVRKELKAATKAIRQALDTYGAALKKWERSSGDFKSARELNPKDEDARQDGETVDRYIAKLIDSIQQMQQAMAAMGNKEKELGEKLKQLKGRIPAPDMPPGAAGDDEEDEDMPNGPKPGEKEGPTKQGEQEMPLSPEQAGWLLEGFKLDSEKRLPMGQTNTAEPKNRNRPTW